jgi:hypothetical protein
MDPIDEPPYRGADACEPTAPADKAECTKKCLRFLSSQETPPVDHSTQEQTGMAPIFTPNMLRDCTADAMLCSSAPRSRRRHRREIRRVIMPPPPSRWRRSQIRVPRTSPASRSGLRTAHHKPRIFCGTCISRVNRCYKRNG